MPIPVSKLKQLLDCMDSLITRLDALEKRRARNDEVEDRDEEIDDPLDAPQQPFSDGAPRRIHGEPEL